MCPICSFEPESPEHAFLLCSWVGPFWFALQICSSPTRMGLQSIQGWTQDLLQNFKEDTPSHDYRISTLFYALWTIRKIRNEKVFKDKNPNPMQTVVQTQFHVTEFIQSMDSNKIDRGNSGKIRTGSHWRPPPDNYIKVNTNAAYSPRNGKCMMGIIFRDSSGTYLTTAANAIVAPSPLVAEALALREAISMAVNLQIPSVNFEYDNQCLIETCRGRAIKEEVRGIITDINIMKR